MSRSGYSDDCDGWSLIRWRGAVASAIRGKRGQAFLRETLDALDAIPTKELITGQLKVHEVNPLLAWLFARQPDPDDWNIRYQYASGWPLISIPRNAGVCALGAVGDHRALDMDLIDYADHETVAAEFGVPHALACEIMFMNDEGAAWSETPRQRWERMRGWLVGAIRGQATSKPAAQVEDDGPGRTT